ncbi:F0F1 ATP synthase subunit A [Aeoliella mucimassa]|uniref:ATP synthase subunit a n=1 Tax=Aeoliella mucimassa TaxID=2527972 RepID=A0A518ANT1_9BACT|nr:F0F1 ATP synthase subunit A [Aeoliella mucimassa]QDU56377.1 ATP synthase subunit a [Aeoliella mucimassa]
MASHDPLSPETLFEHVQDADSFHFPRAFAPAHHGHFDIPQPFNLHQPLWEMKSGNAMLDSIVFPLDLKLTKFMVLELIAAVLIAIFFIGLATKIRYGGLPKGRLWNMLEAMILFIRDNVARPCIGKDDADRYVPFLLTMFFFILGCNLLGMIPWMGSPTGAFAVTAALALMTFIVTVGTGIQKFGFMGFLKSQVPHMDLPGPIGPPMKFGIFLIEMLGLCVKHAVLSIRLLANMFAGHIVLAVIVAFIAATANTLFFWGVMPASILGATAISLLELFVAFLQAYVFVFLASLFIGAAVHPH